MNFSIKIDLLKLGGACVRELKGQNGIQRCLIIPITTANLYEGAKGVYLHLSSREMQTPRFEDTHLVKQLITGGAWKAMSDEQKAAIPILGGMREDVYRREEPAQQGYSPAPDPSPAPAQEPEQEALPF